MGIRAVIITSLMASVCGVENLAALRQGFPTSAKLSDVTKKFDTFRAGIDLQSKSHQTHMNTAVSIGDETLNLSTSPITKLFPPRAKFIAHLEDGKTQSIVLDKALFHEGFVVGEPGSHVHLSVHPSGGVEGVIRRPDGTKYIMSALSRYTDSASSHMHRRATLAHHDTCVYDVESMTPEAMFGMNAEVNNIFQHSKCSGVIPPTTNATQDPARAAFEAARTQAHDEWSVKVAREERSRRDAPTHCADMADRKCSCDMALLGDYEYYLGPNTQEHVEYGMQHMVNVLVEANTIYKNTNFGGTIGLGFVVHSIHIYTSRGSDNPVPKASYGGGSEFLNAVTTGLNSEFAEVCSCMMFTHRDFEEGVLGMAWVSDSNGFGGICDPKYNVGFNTGVNFGQIVSPFVAALVFSHEVGHNCGASHDPEGTECAPGSSGGGNFIMFAAASNGGKPNNHLFSSCSTGDMSTVMNFLRPSCFLESDLGCGDGEVTGDEECDCGDQCTPTSCCTTECTVNRALYECSPQNPIKYPCCTLQCMYSKAGTTCHEGDECADQAECNGTTALCPLDPKEDGTACNCEGGNCTANPGTNPQVCGEGVCHVFVCELYGAEQCGLFNPYSCELGCRGHGWGDGTSCVSTFDVANRPDGVDLGRYLVPGTPCRQNLGRCDAEGTCVLIDQDDGQHAESKEPTLQSWATDHWEAVVAGGCGGVLLLLAVAHYIQHRRYIVKWRESERAHLLAAANAQAEEEDQLVFESEFNEGAEYDDGYSVM